MTSANASANPMERDTLIERLRFSFKNLFRNNMTMPTIEDNIPVPTVDRSKAGRPKGEIRATAEKLEPNQSFLVTPDLYTKTGQRGALQLAGFLNRRYAGERDYVSRKENENVRIWRLK